MNHPMESKTIKCSLKDFFLYFLHLGTFGFGGPITLSGYMQRDLVEKKKWISKEDYVEKGIVIKNIPVGTKPKRLVVGEVVE